MFDIKNSPLFKNAAAMANDIAFQSDEMQRNQQLQQADRPQSGYQQSISQMQQNGKGMMFNPQQPVLGEEASQEENTSGLPAYWQQAPSWAMQQPQQYSPMAFQQNAYQRPQMPSFGFNGMASDMFGGLNSSGLSRVSNVLQQQMNRRPQQQPISFGYQPQPIAQNPFSPQQAMQQAQPREVNPSQEAMALDPSKQKNYMKMAREFFRRQENPGYGTIKPYGWMSDPDMAYFVDAGRKMFDAEKTKDYSGTRSGNYILGGA